MNFREMIARDPRIGYGAAGVLGLVVLLAIFSQTLGRNRTLPGTSAKAYFTTEDQLTGAAAVAALFVDDVNRVPPFDHNGKPAYLAAVMACNDGRTKWVNLLRRYPVAIVPKVQAFVDSQTAQSDGVRVNTSDFDRYLEAKVPGEGKWLKNDSPGFADACGIRLPEGGRVDDLVVLSP